jgi:propionyl-CoA synthetase
MSDLYGEIHARSLNDPETFWSEAAEQIHWDQPWESVLDDSDAPFYRWFRGGVLNTCYNMLDRHADGGRGEQAALIYDSPVTDTVESFTYRELRDLVARFAGALAAQGIGKGDRVILYMPMIPDWAPCTGWCSAASPPTSLRCASTTPSRRWWSPRPVASRERE